MQPYQIYRQYFNPRPIEDALAENTRQVPHWLGNFSFAVYGQNGKSLRKLPNAIKELNAKLASELCPDQFFNTTFIQKYEAGHFVKPHRDPKNNIGNTIIAVLGDFTGAETTLHLDRKIRFTLVAGDVLVLQCTVNGIQGCLHEVSPVKFGTRYAIIQNTIESETPSNTEEFKDLLEY